MGLGGRSAASAHDIFFGRADTLAFLILSPAGDILSASVGVNSLLGYEPAELSGQNISSLYTDADRKSGLPLADLSRASESGCSVAERWHVQKNGIRRYCVVTTVSAALEVETQFFCHLIEDGSALSDSRRARHDSNEKLNLILRATNDAVWDWDVLAGHVSWSAAVEDLFGSYSAAERSNIQWWKDCLHADDCERVYAGLIQALTGQTTHWEDEYRFRRQDGSFAIVFDRGCIVRDANGRAVRMVGAMQDITEREKAKADVEDLNRALQTSNAELQQMAFVASHDLQEPLRTVGSFARLLSERCGKVIDNDCQEYLEYILGGVRRMQALVTGLLAYSRIGTQAAEFENVDLNDIADAAVEGLAEVITESGASITVQELPVISGRSVQLIQVFQNLISNAIKYRSDRPPEIVISAIEHPHSWEIAVADNGIGIAPDHYDRIFGLFKRLHGRDVPGTGLGLALCRRIIEAHGGHIWVDSEVDRGSTFRIALPKAP